MRNLKRALSLALAAIMVLGLMVVGASAASTYDNFTDKDEIVNQEAVNTMVSLGVLAGKDDGSYYDPTGIVTRGEMAKIIAVCLNGGKDPVLGDSTNIPKFSDVPATHWAYNYIAYCVQQNIIAGRGDGTFAPDTAVTGSEAAKMFLCALGYRADLEGLVGNEWELNTNVLANQDADLYDGLESINPSQGLSRDNTAQMAYNAVQAQEVTYNNLFGDYTGVLQTFDKGTMLNNRFGVSKVEGVVVANDIMAIDDGTSTTVAGKSRLSDIYVDGNHRVNNAGNLIDDIYPVALDNSYLGQRVVLYVKGLKDLAPNAASTQVISEPILSADNTVATTTSRMGDTDKVRSFLADNGLTLGANGVDCDDVHGTVFYRDDTTVVNGSRVTRDFAVTAQTNVNGTEYTFIDHDGDGVVDYIFRTLPKMAKVTVYNETDEELTIAGEGSIDFSDIANPEDVAKDDIVLYYIMNDTYYLSVAETVAGKVTAFNNENKTLTMDDVSYSQSTVPVEVSSTDLTAMTVATGGDDGMDFVDNTYTFYLDNSGNVVAWVLGDETVGNYALILGTDVTNNAGFESAKVKLLLADGTTGTYDVNLLASANRHDLDGTTAEKEAAMANILGGNAAGGYPATYRNNRVVTYVIGDDGQVTLGNPATAGNYAVANGTAAQDVTRSTGSYTLGTTTVKVNDSTLFFIRNVNDGANVGTTYSVVQGVSNLPTKVIYKTDGVTKATVDSAVYTTTDANPNVAKAVFVDGDYAGTANYVYVVKSYTGSTTVNGERVYTYPVVFENGEAGTLNISDPDVTKEQVYEYTVNSNGVADVDATVGEVINNVVSTYSRGSNLTIVSGDGSNTVSRSLTIAYGAQLWNVEGDPYEETLTSDMSLALVLDGDGFVKTAFVLDTNVTEGAAAVSATVAAGGVTARYDSVFSGFNAQFAALEPSSTIGSYTYTVVMDNGTTTTKTVTNAKASTEGYLTISMPKNARSVTLDSISGFTLATGTVEDPTADGAASSITIDGNKVTSNKTVTIPGLKAGDTVTIDMMLASGVTATAMVNGDEAIAMAPKSAAGTAAAAETLVAYTGTYIVKADDVAADGSVTLTIVVTLKQADLNNRVVTITVTSESEPAPEGKVNFTVSGSNMTAAVNGAAYTGPVAVDQNSNVTLTVTAAEGYKITAVKVGDTTLTANADGSYTVAVAEADVTVTVATESTATTPTDPNYTATATGDKAPYTITVEYNYTGTDLDLTDEGFLKAINDALATLGVTDQTVDSVRKVGNDYVAMNSANGGTVVGNVELNPKYSVTYDGVTKYVSSTEPAVFEGVAVGTVLIVDGQKGKLSSGTPESGTTWVADSFKTITVNYADLEDNITLVPGYKLDADTTVDQDAIKYQIGSGEFTTIDATSDTHVFPDGTKFQVPGTKTTADGTTVSLKVGEYVVKTTSAPAATPITYDFTLDVTQMLDKDSTSQFTIQEEAGYALLINNKTYTVTTLTGTFEVPTALTDDIDGSYVLVLDENGDGKPEIPAADDAAVTFTTTMSGTTHSTKAGAALTTTNAYVTKDGAYVLLPAVEVTLNDTVSWKASGLTIDGQTAVAADPADGENSSLFFAEGTTLAIAPVAANSDLVTYKITETVDTKTTVLSTDGPATGYKVEEKTDTDGAVVAAEIDLQTRITKITLADGGFTIEGGGAFGVTAGSAFTSTPTGATFATATSELISGELNTTNLEDGTTYVYKITLTIPDGYYVGSDLTIANGTAVTLASDYQTTVNADGDEAVFYITFTATGP